MINIDHTQLHPDTLDNLLMEYIIREGTDYGVNELTLNTKRERLKKQLSIHKAFIIFDPSTESFTISDEPWQQEPE